MNSLEFIDKEIESIQRILNDEDSPFKKDNTFWNNKLIHLNQIKAILEAWEVVKRELKLTVKEDKHKYEFVYYWLIYHPYELLEIEKQDYEIIKKALEVSDEIQSNV